MCSGVAGRGGRQMKIIGLAGLLLSFLLLGNCTMIVGAPTLITDLAVEAEVNPVRPAIGSAVDVANGGSQLDTETVPESGSEPPIKEIGTHRTGTDLLYEDVSVSVTWHLHEAWFWFELVNKTDHPLHIVWDEALVAAESHWERLVDRSRTLPQEPTIVAPLTVVSLTAAPLSALTRYDTRSRRGWRCEDGPLGTTPGERQSKAKVRRLAKKAVGHRFRVLLPLEIEGMRIDYIFSLTVTAAEARTVY
jgi:hypothetical protein